MDYEKITVVIPDIKRVSLPEKGKVKYSDGVAEFKTKAGKSMTVPTESILFQDEKSITFKYPRRKIVKGKFTAKDGFMVDSVSGSRLSTAIMTFGEVPKASSPGAKERGKALAASRGKLTLRKAAKTSSGKLRVKIKK